MVLQGAYVDVDVTIDSVLPARGLGGFDLLITFDNAGLALQSVTEGDIYEQCGWEYFTYRYGADSNCPDCPPGLVRVIGIAETNNGDDHPTCGFPDSLPATLFTLRFFVSNDRSLDCTYSPIRFFWRDCDDNRLKCESGYCDYFMTGRVFDSLGAHSPIDPTTAFFPGTNGLPGDSCWFIQNLFPSPQRFVDFYHGGLEIVCADSIDSRGDVNLNGFPNELADIVLFQRYFIYGNLVFTINLAGQTLSTDVNGDGIPLTVEDFCFMYRVVAGAELGVRPPLDTATFELSQGALTLTSTDTLGALLLTVAGEATPVLHVDHVGMQYYFDGQVTRIFVSPILDYSEISDSAYILPSTILTGLEGHEILSIQTAEYRGGKLIALLLETGSTKYQVAIQKNQSVMPYGPLSADVNLTEIGQLLRIGAFDFLIAYPRALGLDNVVAGEIFENCDWEYFTYRNDTALICDTCSFNKVRVIALFDINNGSFYPDTTCPENLPITLFTLNFHIADQCRFECTLHPIRFYWESCDDNIISDLSGVRRLYEDQVYDSWNYQNPIPPEYAVFPGFGGVPSGLCIPGAIPVISSYPGIDFYNGGFDFMCNDSVDGRGDLNLDGDSYEIADEELFARYLVEGISVFDIMPNAQLATADINSDNQPGTLQDFAIFRRNACGYRCEPIPQGVDTARFYCLDSKVLFLVSEDTLGALLLTIDGNVSATLLDTNLVLKSNQTGGVTYLLIHMPPGDCDGLPGIVSGPLLRFQGNIGIPNLKTINYLGGQVVSLLDIVSDADDDNDPNLPATFALHQNYPNPFNAGTVISFDLPRASEVKLEIINVLGNVVYRHSGDFSAGTHRIHWQGTTTASKPVASGIYYYRLTTASFTATKKMLLLK
ncbi:MAG: T9SS type A sorting domain-containing protein [bacterium]|nr:T9SS type A sorting domain-containing protein [bacterium]